MDSCESVTRALRHIPVIQVRTVAVTLMGFLSSQAWPQQEITRKVYGRLTLNYEQASVNRPGIPAGTVASVNRFSLQSYSSRIGIKGSYRQTASDPFTVIYQLEYQVSPDDGNPVLRQRNSFVGIKGAFGQALAGVHDTPLKKAQLQLDQLNHTVYDIKVLLRGDNRVGPILHYTSPEIFSRLKFKLASVVSGEVGKGPEESVSLSAEYKYSYSGGELQLISALDENINEYSGTRLAAFLKHNSGLELGLLSQSTKRVRVGTAVVARQVFFSSTVLSAQYKWNDSSVFAQAVISDERIHGAELFAVGYRYRLTGEATWSVLLGAVDAPRATALDGSPPADVLSTGVKIHF